MYIFNYCAYILLYYLGKNIKIKTNSWLKTFNKIESTQQNYEAIKIQNKKQVKNTKLEQRSFKLKYFKIAMDLFKHNINIHTLKIQK